MLVMTSYNPQNETQDIFDAATSLCIFYGSPDEVLQWLVMRNFQPVNLTDWFSPTYGSCNQPMTDPHT